MIERYTLPRMGEIWTEEHKFQKWLEVEIAVCEALAQKGEIPAEALQAIRDRAYIDIKKIKEIEATVRHELISFLTALAETIGEEARYLHLGLTSYDVIDTALALQMREASDIIIEDLERLLGALQRLATTHKWTVMVGRTHGVHAEPTTFGLKVSLWLTETQRNLERLKRARSLVNVGKISGAVGTYANVEPSVEEYVCRKLGLKPVPISTQILQRDRHADFLCTLAIIASSLEKFATEIRNLQRTEILEVEEPFARGQKGSSAMPHKRNPEISERIAGLSRVVRGNALAALENISLWHERDLTNSSVERVIIPDSAILVDYMLNKFTDIVENLTVYPERMKRNLEKTRGLIYSEQVLLKLTKKGVSRVEAYEMVQRNALDAWREERDFKDLLLKDPEILRYLNTTEIEECFHLEYCLRNIDVIYKRLGI